MNTEEKIRPGGIALRVQKNIRLDQLTTFKIGGMAKLFIEIENENELCAIFEWLKEHNEKWIVLAGGSNSLVNENGFDGLVILIKNNDIVVKGDRLECGAGCFLSTAVTTATSHSLSGLEWAAGIPGSVGGAIRGNAGAYGGSISGIVELVNVYCIEKNKFEIFSHKDCAFLYRNSFFKSDGHKKYIIWRSVLKLRKGKQDDIYELVNQNINKRQSKQPKLPSAGCVFKNFNISDLKIQNKELAKLAIEKGVVKNDKVAAGWIISLLDLQGKSIGGAKISLEHANFIVNTSKASANDVVMLISMMKQKVRQRFNVQLQEEIEYIGF